MEQADKEWVKDWVREYSTSNFVKKDDCNSNMSDVDKKFANDDTRIKLFEQQLSMWSKLFWVIASATVGQLVVSVFGLIGGA